MTDSRIRLYQAITDIDDDIIEEAQGIDRVTKSRYKVDARKESFTLAPAAVTDDPEEKPAEESEDKQG